MGIWEALKNVLEGFPIFLNRAPTLHRLGIQAFEPIIVDGRAIRLHPLVCPAFNADFDGDQMAIHVPLSIESQAESYLLMLGPNNFMSPATGEPILLPSQDMVLGSHYLTSQSRSNFKGSYQYFGNVESVLQAYNCDKIALHSSIWLRFNGQTQTSTPPILLDSIRMSDGSVIYVYNDRQIRKKEGETLVTYILTTPGRVFYNKTINKKELKSIVHSAFQSYGIVKATNLAECLKKEGFSFATQAGISISVEDLKVPPTKNSLFLKNNKQINLAYFYEKRGNINEVERFQKVIDTWHTTSEILKNQLVDFFKSTDPLNPVYMMAFSGARGNLSQVRQLVGMRGLMSDPNGQIIDLPIKANFREGLSITDYVISSYGARKGIVDTALKTADSGYLTRRLVDVAQHVIIRELDCETKNGVRVLYDPDQNQDGRYFGRVLAKSVYNPVSGDLILERNTPLTLSKLNKIDFVTDLVLRSPLICEASNSICQKCYGWNLSQGKLVELADAVGVIAAQSIGEPGTQLTMRTFHTGGVFTGESSNQIYSAIDGQILFSSTLKTSTSRTIYGEIILKAINSSEFFIFDKPM